MSAEIVSLRETIKVLTEEREDRVADRLQEEKVAYLQSHRENKELKEKNRKMEADNTDQKRKLQSMEEQTQVDDKGRKHAFQKAARCQAETNQ